MNLVEVCRGTLIIDLVDFREILERNVEHG